MMAYWATKWTDNDLTISIIYPITQLVSTSGRLTSPKDGAIHTIPAPNLAGSNTKPLHQLKITSFEDSNHLEIDIQKPTKAAFPAKSTYASPSPTYGALSTVSVLRDLKNLSMENWLEPFLNYSTKCWRFTYFEI